MHQTNYALKFNSLQLSKQLFGTEFPSSSRFLGQSNISDKVLNVGVGVTFPILECLKRKNFNNTQLCVF
jgi:hypothetical protein